MKNQEIYNYILKIQAIAKTGLTYSHDPYAIDNYQQINELSRQFLEDFMNVKIDRPNFFEKHIYPTPNVSVRTVIFNKDKTKVLLVKEKDDGYSLPGGWADLFETPSEAAKKECLEETGAEVKIDALCAVISHTPLAKYNADFVPDYVLVFRGSLIKQEQDHDYEIENVDFFDINNLPSTSRKCQKVEMEKMIQCALQDKVYFD